MKSLTEASTLCQTECNDLTENRLGLDVAEVHDLEEGEYVDLRHGHRYRVSEVSGSDGNAETGTGDSRQKSRMYARCTKYGNSSPRVRQCKQLSLQREMLTLSVPSKSTCM